MVPGIPADIYGVGFSIFTPVTFGALARALDAASLRQEAIASNLANANTPGYHRKDVAFSLDPDAKAGRATVMTRHDARHFTGPRPDRAGVVPALVTDNTGAMRLDGNNIDPDAEAARLAETEVTYAALTQALSTQFAGLRISITGTAR